MHLNMSIKTFNAYKDLDRDFWLKRAFAEAKKIYSKISTRRNRTLNRIEKDTAFGHAAECWLIQEYNFKDDTREYKDLFDPNGNPVEVKVVGRIENVPYELQNCANRMREKWRQHPEIVYMFIGNRETGDYHFHSKYVWHELQGKFY